MPDNKESLAVTQRFLELADMLSKKNGTISAFAASIEIAPQSLHSMRRGERYVTVDILVRTCTLYNANPAWLLLGTGNKFQILSENDKGSSAGRCDNSDLEVKVYAKLFR